MIIRRHRGTVTIELPIKTVNPNNGQLGFSKGAAMGRARKRAQNRATVCLAVRSALGLTMSLPVVVTLTRIAPSSGLDEHDGLRAALKSIADGVTDALVLKSDRDPLVTWRYDQRRGPAGHYAVEIAVCPRQDDRRAPPAPPSGPMVAGE